MAIIGSYDTDDLTQRQYHYFRKLNKDTTKGAINMFAYGFLRSCVKQNFSRNEFDNYDGDCDYLFWHRESSIKLGINLDEVYT